MFDIGFWELVVISVIGLLVLGPERLPGAIRSVQRSLSQLRAFGTKMQAELNHELRIKELHEDLKKIESSTVKGLTPELKRSLAELEAAAEQVREPYAQDKRTQENENVKKEQE